MTQAVLIAPPVTTNPLLHAPTPSSEIVKPVVPTWLFWSVIVVAIATRLLNAFWGVLNSDESQHMHVLWALSHGAVQYRDVWDNHAPLFHILWRPIFALAPQTSSVLSFMRLTMLPLNLITMLGTFVLGSVLFDRRVGLWAAVVILAWPTSQRLAVEVRPDHFWALFWVGALIALYRGIIRPRQAAIFGLLLGAAMCASLKSSVLVATLIVAAIMMRSVAGPGAIRPWRSRLMLGCAFMSGILAIPIAIIVWFSHLHALDSLYRGTLGINFAGGGSLPHKSHSGVALFVTIVVLTWIGLRFFIGRKTLRGVARRRVWFICSTSIAICSFKFLWPIFERQDWLPLAPMFAVAGCGLIALAWERWRLRFIDPLTPIRIEHFVKMGALITLAVLAIALSPFRQYNAKYYAAIDMTNDLVSSSEPVVDVKGELIFHPRGIPFVCETLTRTQLKADPNLDTGPADIRASGAMLSASPSARFPVATRRFVRNNYVPIGKNIDVAGKQFFTDANVADIEFDLNLPGDYDLIAKQNATPTGTMDGKPIAGPLTLAAGHHVLHLNQPLDDAIAIIWHRATARGYSVVWSDRLK